MIPLCTKKAPASDWKRGLCIIGRYGFSMAFTSLFAM